ncbi:MAG TPA: TonB-dependent siderophore receptor [Usitatibacter sp.]|nr:TonB-dependent siderophore receptor [Usitatibacter sp.]
MIRNTPFRARPLAELIRAGFAPTAFGLAAAFPLPATAQAPAPATDKKETTLPEVKVKSAIDQDYKMDASSTATKTETPLRDIPQFINTIPEAVLRAQNATSLQEALRNVPGVSYAAGEGGTQANQVFYLRGFPAGGDIFIDGVRDLGEYNRDVFAVESVEVLKGPSALIFGRGSTGGIINQTSKVPGIVERKEVAFTYGNFDKRRLTADYNANLGDDRGARLVALYEDSGSYRYPQDVKREGFAPSFRFGIGHPLDVTLSHYYLKTGDVTDYGQPSLSPAATGTGLYAMPPVSPRNYYGYANHDYADHTTHITTARIDWRISRNVELRNTTRLAKYERSVEATIATLHNLDANGAPVMAGTPLGLLQVRRNHDTGRTRDNDDGAIINQTDVTWKLRSGGVKHTLLTGLELSRERLDRVNFALDADPTQPGTQAPTSFTSFLDPDPSTLLAYTKTPNVHALAEGKTAAAYVQDQIEFSERWKALLGARFDHYKAEARTESALTGAGITGPFSRTEKMWSYRAGLIHQPTATQSCYLSVGNSYNPSGELGVYGQNGTNLNPVNEDLSPERNVGYELGATWDFSHGMQLRAAIFRNEKSNARKLEEDGSTLLTGKRRVDGIEVQLAGYILPNWEIYSGVAFMDGKIVDAPDNIVGKKPLGVAEVAGNVWTVYRLGGGWEIGGGVRGTSGFWLNDANTGEVPAAVVVDLTAAYAKDDYEIRLNVINASDKTYYIGGYQNNPNRVIPGEPRTYSVTFRYNF